jgi:hypothetical protein
MPVPHKWKEIISAWAAGEVIQQRILSYDEETWGPWTVLKDGHAPIRTDMYIEYRVEPKDEPHKWQKEREAFLAGTRVEFRKRNSGSIGIHWHQVDTWLEADCRRQGIPIWDREYLEFRIVPEQRTYQAKMVDAFDPQSGPYLMHHPGVPPNLKLTFVNGKLKEAEVLN